VYFLNLDVSPATRRTAVPPGGKPLLPRCCPLTRLFHHNRREGVSGGRYRVHGAQTDAGIPGGMLRDVSEYTLEIQLLTLPQQIVVRNPG